MRTPEQKSPISAKPTVSFQTGTQNRFDKPHRSAGATQAAPLGEEQRLLMESHHDDDDETKGSLHSSVRDYIEARKASRIVRTAGPKDLTVTQAISVALMLLSVSQGRCLLTRSCGYELEMINFCALGRPGTGPRGGVGWGGGGARCRPGGASGPGGGPRGRAGLLSASTLRDKGE